ncbi:MAG: zinc ABC transporter substrate-binding protein [Clostridia bacterium]|nr:zinc ABC transporter substrate-binding protein [Clostridia bacterium]
MKKSIAFIVMLAFIFVALTAIIINIKHPKSKNNGEKIEVVATLFPQYDFAKQVGGDKVNVTLLLPPGTESHTYEPTPQDMVMIDQSNLFIYTGEEMEPWAENLISGMKNNINVLDLSKSVELINVEEFEEEHENDEEHHHHEEDEDDNEHEHSHEDEHHHTYDPHIWLNPQYAVKMVRSIEQELGKIDPDNAEYYKTNADNYIRQIMDLDAEFEETVRNAQNPKLAFGGAFAYAYFVERYSLDFISAYETCGESAEPSTVKVKEVIDYIKANRIPVVFYKEYTNGNIAKTISDATGAKMLVFNTVHNVSKDEIKSGASYVSIMRSNLENLKQALK